MKKLGVIVIALGALMLGGCATNGGAETVATGAAEAPAEVAPTTNAAPLDGFPTESANASDSYYLESLTPRWRGELPEEAMLISTAKSACLEMSAGVNPETLAPLPGAGEDAEWNNKQLVIVAIAAYCPEFAS